ncbi:PRP38-domain-containing protein [Microstroma glucosiphilum]|uniref:Pre-mRNA-splicing factor 38 n=1 Tax=Pseudomicrostroma glucosiphilum TaxID=1684307 RepID=A0A316U7S5_9BASI|nr:PRP38-domain-containing protein [Pseudomicrostroma glucosiphilum]PWN21212.1 PRP38-domain-containing protein [Pseudomicrostroma glucosiphilum]
MPAPIPTQETSTAAASSSATAPTSGPPPPREYLGYRAPRSVHGTNPQFLIEKAIRSRIYDCLYWKSVCFGLSAETLVDEAALRLPCVGGSYGGTLKPTEFLCLALKMLQLQPEEGILREYLGAKEFKYLRALTAFYIRLVCPALQVYTLLEPLLSDYRKLRYRSLDGSYRLTHMDTFVDELLTEERVCDVILPRLVKREVLEEREGLPPRGSVLEEALLEGEEGEGEGSGEEGEMDEAERERKRRWREKVARGREAREARLRAEAEREAGVAAPAASNGVGRGEAEPRPPSPVDESEVGYASQEDSEDERERYVSRSPSRSVSPDRQSNRRSVASSASPYRSRSPSPGSGNEA